MSLYTVFQITTLIIHLLLHTRISFQSNFITIYILLILLCLKTVFCIKNRKSTYCWRLIVSFISKISEISEINCMCVSIRSADLISYIVSISYYIVICFIVTWSNNIIIINTVTWSNNIIIINTVYQHCRFQIQQYLIINYFTSSLQFYHHFHTL